MATLKSLVAKYGVAGTARIFQSKDHDVTEGRIREAIKVRKGRRPETARANKAKLEGYAKEVNLTKEYRKGAPGPEVVSAKVISSPVKTRTVQGRHGTYTTIETGRWPHIDRANNAETWTQPRRALHRESLERLLGAAAKQFDGQEVTVRIYGRFKTSKGNYRLSGRGGEFGWREDFYRFNTTMRSLAQALADTNRAITREMNATADRKERKWIEQGNPDNDEVYPAPSARWAAHASPIKIWSEVNYISIEPVLATVKSRL